MPYTTNRHVIAASLMLFLVSCLILLSVVAANGVEWDFLTQYLIGRTLLNSSFYSLLYLLNQPIRDGVVFSGYTYHGVIITTFSAISKGIIFEKTREPVVPILLSLAMLINQALSIQIYALLLLSLLLFSSFFVAKQMNINPLIVCSLILGPYVLRHTFVYNSTEMLSIGVCLIALGFMARRSSLSGLFLGIAGVSKYTNLILLPLLLLLIDKDNTEIKAAALFLIATLPWLVFNFIVYGNPLYSYYLNIAALSNNAQNLISFPYLFAEVAWYPIIVIAIVLLLLARKMGVPNKLGINDLIAKVKAAENYNHIAVTFFVILAIIGFFFVYNTVGIPIRFGYLAYAGLAVFGGLLLESRGISNAEAHLKSGLVKLGAAMPFALFSVTLVLLCYMYLNSSQNGFNWSGYRGSNNPDFHLSLSALQSHNLSGCSIVSNAWPYMNYYNVLSYSSDACNLTTIRYPIVIFGKFGGLYCNSLETNSLPAVSQTFNYGNFSIYLPPNFECAR